MPRKVMLDPMDYFFLLGETRQQMMHVGSLIFYNVPEGSNPDEEASRVHTEMLEYDAPYNPFNYKLSFSLGRPCWVEDIEFDINNHVRHVRLPHPGSIKELLHLVGVLHGLQLDRSLPLWTVWVISGLPDNRFAIYTKIHHALVDGVSGARMISMMHCDDPEEHDMPPFWALDMSSRRKTGKNKVGAPRVKKGDLTVMTREMLATMAALGGGLIKSNTKIAKIMMDAWKKQRVSTFRSKLYYAPPSLLNQRITGSRRFVADSFSLERIKAAGKAFGGSINDCLVAMTGYALRKYLRGLKKLPRGSLITALPVNLREDDSLGGNQVGMIRVTLGTNISQTARRLKAITDSVAEQKAILKSLSKEEKLIYSAVSLAPSGLQLGTGLFPQFQTFNVVISNVPGPKERLYWNGLELDALYPVSIPVHQAAMNITIFSYADKIEIGIIACRNALPSIQRLIDYMHEGLADIERVTGLTKKGR